MRGIWIGILAMTVVLLTVSCGEERTKEPAIGSKGGDCYEDNTCEGDLVCVLRVCYEAGVSGEMVDVPAGEFWMGCNEDVDMQCHWYDWEKPYHHVYLDAYKIGKYEVTVGEYQQCVASGACNNNEAYPHYSSSMTDDSPCNYDAEGKKDQPMNCVTWYGADAYCKWIGGRLPTEAEWEKAARGTAGRKYPWGNEPAVSCDYAVMGPHNDSTGEYDDGCGTGGTMPVGSKPNGVSPYGAYDMIGNVWEWVHDWCCSDYSIYSSLANNPKGPISGDQRMMRGGAWKSSYDEVLRASARRYGSPTYKSGDIGLRCAK